MTQQDMVADPNYHDPNYQGSYKSFPIQEDRHLVTVIRYVEQNPLRARLVTRAERWPWSSLYRRRRGNKEDKKLLAQLPMALPRDYLSLVNTVDKQALEAIRTSVRKGGAVRFRCVD